MNQILLNKINFSFFLCENALIDNGKITAIDGIKNIVKVNNDLIGRFNIAGKLDFFETVIPNNYEYLTLLFYIRTLNEIPLLRTILLDAQLHISKEFDNIVTQSIDFVFDIGDVNFPKTGTFAIEVYKHWGEIKKEIIENQPNAFIKQENFLNALIFEVK